MASFSLYSEDKLEDGRVTRSYMLPLGRSLGYACKAMNLPDFSHYEATVTGYILPDDFNGAAIGSADELQKYAQEYKSILCNFMNGTYNHKPTDIQVDLETDMLYIESDSAETIEKIIGELAWRGR